MWSIINKWSAALSDLYLQTMAMNTMDQSTRIWLLWSNYLKWWVWPVHLMTGIKEGIMQVIRIKEKLKKEQINAKNRCLIITWSLISAFGQPEKYIDFISAFAAICLIICQFWHLFDSFGRFTPYSIIWESAMVMYNNKIRVPKIMHYSYELMHYFMTQWDLKYMSCLWFCKLSH